MLPLAGPDGRERSVGGRRERAGGADRAVDLLVEGVDPVDERGANVAERLQVAADGEEPLSRDIGPGGLDDRAADDDAVTAHDRALGMRGGEGERVLDRLDEDGVGERRGESLVACARRQELAGDAEDTAVVRLQRKRRLGDGEEEARRSELSGPDGGEHLLERVAASEDRRLECGAERGVERRLEARARLEVVGENSLGRDARGREGAARGLAARLPLGERRLEGCDAQGDLVLAREELVPLGPERREALLGGAAPFTQLLELGPGGLEGGLRGFFRGGGLPCRGLAAGEGFLRPPDPFVQLRQGEGEPLGEEHGLSLAVSGVGGARAGGKEIAPGALAPGQELRLARRDVLERGGGGREPLLGRGQLGVHALPRGIGTSRLLDGSEVVGLRLPPLGLQQLPPRGGLLALPGGRCDGGFGGEERLTRRREGVAQRPPPGLVLVGHSPRFGEGSVPPPGLGEGVRLGVRRGGERPSRPRRDLPPAGRTGGGGASSSGRRATSACSFQRDARDACRFSDVQFRSISETMSERRRRFAARLLQLHLGLAPAGSCTSRRRPPPR